MYFHKQQKFHPSMWKTGGGWDDSRRCTSRGPPPAFVLVCHRKQWGLKKEWSWRCTSVPKRSANTCFCATESQPWASTHYSKQKANATKTLIYATAWTYHHRRTTAQKFSWVLKYHTKGVLDVYKDSNLICNMTLTQAQLKDFKHAIKTAKTPAAIFCYSTEIKPSKCAHSAAC